MENLCIGCWFGECGGDHRDPDLGCACCMGMVEIVAADIEVEVMI